MGTLIGIAGVVLGIGFLIFIHELGHFLVAKWYDVRVEKFSIGFGPSIWETRRGETTYALAWIPLGGYVAMLQEEARPDEAITDPRAFPNKPVGQRMMIMSAGVIMNVLFGLALFIGLYGSGMMIEAPAVLGYVAPGSPAYKAGLIPGDEVVALDGDGRDLDFERLRMRIMLSGRDELVTLSIKRQGVEQPFDVAINPRAEQSDLAPKIGVLEASSLKLHADRSAAKLPAYLAPPGVVEGGPTPDLQGDDRIEAVGPVGGEPVPVATFEDFRRVATEHRGAPLRVVAERPGPEGSAATERVRTTVPANRFVDFGLILTPGPITAIRGDSPAARAGLVVGDQIVSVDNDADFDPIRLPFLLRDKAGTAVSLGIRREGSDQVITIGVTPDETPPWPDIVGGGEEALDLPPIGAAFPIKPLVRAVRPDSPAAKAGIVVGARLGKITLTGPDPSKPGKTKSTPLELAGDEAVSWVVVLNLLQHLPRHASELTVAGSEAPIKLTAEPVDGWWHVDRGLRFGMLIKKLPPLGIGGSIRRGYEETMHTITTIYYSILRLFQGQVSRKMVGGPIMIFQAGYGFASAGLLEFLKFLGLMSINLAVVNFLPIYPLDGGQMLLLLGEKVRGRPLPARLMAATQWVGIVLVLMLMVFAIGQDIIRVIFGS